MLIQSNVNGNSTYCTFLITSSSYTSESFFNVTFVSGTLPSNGSVNVISFTKNGAQGIQGTQGTQGNSGPQGRTNATGLVYAISQGLQNIF